MHLLDVFDLGKARSEDGVYLWIDFVHFMKAVTAIHFWHDHVEYDEIDVGMVFGVDLSALFAILGKEYSVA